MATDEQQQSPSERLINRLKGERFTDLRDLEAAIGSTAWNNWKEADLSSYFNPEGFADLAIRNGWVAQENGEYVVVGA